MRIRSAASLLTLTAAFLACTKRPPPAEPRQETHVVAAPPSAAPSTTTEAQPTKPQGTPPMSCTGTPTDITPLWQLATYSGGASCSPSSIGFGLAAGEPCSHPSECASSCCACADGKTAVPTSLCLNGHCSSAMDTCCALAGTKTYSCGNANGHSHADGSRRLFPFIIRERVLFGNGSAKIDLAMMKLLDDIADVVKRKHVRMLRIEGHTDNAGNAQSQQRISEQRADAVRQYLIKQGVEAGRMQSVGYAAKRPIDTNATEEGRAKNRRVEFIVIE